MQRTIMRQLTYEHDVVQNAALGASCIWMACRGYSENTDPVRSMPLLYSFLVLPLIYNERTRKVISKTFQNSGLRQFAGKLERDELMAIHERALSFRAKSWESVEVARHFGLVGIDTTTASIFPLTIGNPRKTPETVRKMLAQCEKLGGWFSQASPFEVANILRVDF